MRLHPSSNRILVVLFVAVLVIPALATLAGIDRPSSREENRDLAPFPSVQLTVASLRAFPDAFTKYFEDNFSFRARLVQWQAAFRFRELRVSPSPTVIAGSDGFLFYADDGAVEDFADTEPFTTAELQLWRDILQRNQDWLSRRGIRYVFVIAPDKHVVYPELMPAALHRVHDGSRIDQLVDYLRAHSTVNVVDVREALREASRHDRLYHRTDTHWNDLGALIAYQQILTRSGLANMTPATRADFDERETVIPGMDLAGMIGLKDVLSEDELRLVPRRPRRATILEPAHPDRLLMDAKIVTEIPDPRLPRALVLRDSFTSAMIPFLSEHFSRAVYLWQYNFDPAAIEQEHPNVVIQEWVGRRLGNLSPYNAGADLSNSTEPAPQSAPAVPATARTHRRAHAARAAS